MKYPHTTGNKTHQLILMAFFTALIAIGAFIRIPVPVVPFTLQFLFTTMAGMLLGNKLGGASVLVYIALGLLGLPIFASGWGDGYYPVYFGYDAKGEVCAVYVRFIDIEASYREQD